MELIAMTKIHAWRVSRQLPNAFLLATGPIGTGNGLAPAEQASCRLQTGARGGQVQRCSRRQPTHGQGGAAGNSQAWG